MVNYTAQVSSDSAMAIDRLFLKRNIFAFVVDSGTVPPKAGYYNIIYLIKLDI